MSLLRYLAIRAARVAALRLHARVARFKRACEHPEALQTELLLRTLARQSATAFGQDHGFAGIRTVADYRKQVPIAPYERLAPYIERLKNGETAALLADDVVRLFALTSGTTAARKFIPVTDRYLKDYSRTWAMWGVKFYREHRPRDLALRPIVQMVGDPDEFRTPAGIPCGNLSGFTTSLQRPIARRMYSVPMECAKIKDPLARYYLAVLFNLGRPTSTFFAANPSTLITFARTLNDHRERLLKDLHDGTLNAELNIPSEFRAALQSRRKPNPNAARTLAAVAERQGRLYPQDVWHPDTIAIGTWTGGSMGPYLRQLPTFFGNVPTRDLGLLASEGRFTLPLQDNTPSGVLDISSHYFEFVPEGEIDSSQPNVLGAHELQEGKAYYLIPTTQAGLYRYHISDLVEVTGFLGHTPMVKFLGKGSRFSNLTGEKLSEHHVTQAVEEVQRASGYSVGSYTVAPVWDDVRPYYAIVVEAPDVRDGWGGFLVQLDAAMQRLNIEYESKRSGGRLGLLQAKIVPDGFWSKWDADRLAKTGGSPEQFKRPCLMGDPEFVRGL
jgi:hypothetical protein